MHKNYGFYQFNSVNVVSVQVWSQGFFADGKNGCCENFKLRY